MNKQEKKVRRKKKVGSYQYGSVIFSVALALFVVGLFGMLLLHTNRLTSVIQENIEIQVYLNKNTSENQRNRIQREISTSPYVLKKEEKPQIVFISKEEAAKQFVKDTGEDFSEFLGDNPLRDALVVNIAPEFQTNAKLDSIGNKIEAISGVFEVTFVESLVDSINKNLRNIGLILMGFAIILLIVVVMLINNTIKLALFSQRFLIRSSYSGSYFCSIALWASSICQHQNRKVSRTSARSFHHGALRLTHYSGKLYCLYQHL